MAIAFMHTAPRVLLRSIYNFIGLLFDVIVYLYIFLRPSSRLREARKHEDQTNMTDMCLGHRCHYQISKPLICILLRHVSGEVKLIKVMMSCSTKRTKLVICQTTDRDIGAGMNSDIGIAFRKVAAHIKHLSLIHISAPTRRS